MGYYSWAMPVLSDKVENKAKQRLKQSLITGYPTFNYITLIWTKHMSKDPIFVKLC